jgi:hypothetical protein
MTMTLTWSRNITVNFCVLFLYYQCLHDSKIFTALLHSYSAIVQRLSEIIGDGGRVGGRWLTMLSILFLFFFKCLLVNMYLFIYGHVFIILNGMRQCK